MTNVCGAAGNLIYPPMIYPGETARWTTQLFLKLLIFRRKALLSANQFAKKLQFPLLITADTLSGVKQAYFEACKLFCTDGCILYKTLTFFSSDMIFLQLLIEY